VAFSHECIDYDSMNSEKYELNIFNKLFGDVTIPAAAETLLVRTNLLVTFGTDFKIEEAIDILIFLCKAPLFFLLQNCC